MMVKVVSNRNCRSGGSVVDSGSEGGGDDDGSDSDNGYNYNDGSSKCNNN